MTSLHIGFSPAFEEHNAVAIVQEGELPEYLQIWVWDLYYANVLHTLEDETLVGELRETLESWAGTVIGSVFAPAKRLRQEGLLGVDKALTLEAAVSADTREVYAIDVEQGAQAEWPEIRVDCSVERTPAHMAYSVVALAQYFQERNAAFARELPIHVLAMRKYYEDERPVSAPESLVEAPAYALQKALKFYQEMGGPPQ